jgi:hypothetical protein
MKNISRLLIILLSASFILSSCEDEDVLNLPDFTVPVILLSDNTSGVIIISDVGTPAEATFNFTLDAENFDGSSDGHKFYVGRSGTTSTLIDVTLIATFSGGGTGEIVTIQGSELPSSQNITLAQLASAVGVPISDMGGGDSFVITYEYRIDSNNSGNILLVTTPGNDYCGGSTNEGEFCTMRVDIVCQLAEVVTDPFPGDYVVDMVDSYGDGWNGATIEATLDGAVTVLTVEGGTGGPVNFNVPAGSSSLGFVFTSGDWDSEITWEISDPAGNSMATGGPSPPIGPITLSVCL